MKSNRWKWWCDVWKDRKQIFYDQEETQYRKERRVYDYFTNKLFYFHVFFNVFFFLPFHLCSLWKCSLSILLSSLLSWFRKWKSFSKFQWKSHVWTFHAFSYRIFQIIKYSHADGRKMNKIEKKDSLSRTWE